MKVVVLSKTNFIVVQHNNVSNIAYSSGSVVITSGGTNYTYSLENYAISILFE